MVCKYGDPTCPCRDGDQCHYGELHNALADTRLCAKLLLKQTEHLAEFRILTFGDMLDYLT